MANKIKNLTSSQSIPIRTFGRKAMSNANCGFTIEYGLFAFGFPRIVAQKIPDLERGLDKGHLCDGFVSVHQIHSRFVFQRRTVVVFTIFSCVDSCATYRRSITASVRMKRERASMQREQFQ